VDNNYQIVSINNDQAICEHCGSNISDIINFLYANRTEAHALYSDEYCICKKCKSTFIIRYDIFDPEGHIYSRVFSEDINDATYRWQDHLTVDQKNVIAEHLKECVVCHNRLSQEILTDAWLKSIIEDLRKKNGYKI
jgi:hypothetical protein